MKEGWICPRCGVVNAPFVEKCTCKSNGMDEYSNINTNAISECLKENHKWECYGMDTGGFTYRCSVCGKIKRQIFVTNEKTLTLESTEKQF